MPGPGGGARRSAGTPVLVLAAVTGQPGADPLDAANRVDERLLDAVAAGLREVPVTAARAPGGDGHAPVVARTGPGRGHGDRSPAGLARARCRA